jgi:3-dehydroquinate synthase
MMLQKKADRQALFICLGGGVICDMGGLIAALYKRGLDFIHIPTTVLAQVDASVGAKLAVDFQGVKNMLGLFAPPQTVLIYTGFLKTLTRRDCYNGFAEMLKHALLVAEQQWADLLNINPEQLPLEQIRLAIRTKSEIVAQDPREAGLRKSLNIGHTWGHALESWALQTDFPLFHGEAVILGLVAELHISQHLLHIPSEWINARIQALLSIYEAAFLTDWVLFLNHIAQLPRISDFSRYLHQDKKNQANTMLLPLVANFGDIRIDTPVSLEQMEKGLIQLFETLRAGWGLK